MGPERGSAVCQRAVAHIAQVIKVATRITLVHMRILARLRFMRARNMFATMSQEALRSPAIGLSRLMGALAVLFTVVRKL
ncbi:hypothetical protein AEAC466_21465 [Asticcacaulis sp. AC466]|nr:hypothetical protein AEAC466_21465 [Asticcacaulis sp. AC466]